MLSALLKLNVLPLLPVLRLQDTCNLSSLNLVSTQPNPTPIYEDNASTIMIINVCVPTERTGHIDVQHFAIQDWNEDGSIEILHIPGGINPPDDLTKPLGWVLQA